MAEEHCWTITQACRHAGGRSCFSVLQSGFQLNSLVYRHWVDRTYIKFRLVPELPERNYCVICEVSVLHSPSGEVNGTSDSQPDWTVTQPRRPQYTWRKQPMQFDISSRLSVALKTSHKWLLYLAQFYVNNGSHQPHGVTAPSGPGLPPCRSFKLTLRHTLRPVGLLRTSEQSDAETSTWQHTTLTTDIHAAGGIRTRDPNQRTAEEPGLRPRGHWNRLKSV